MVIDGKTVNVLDNILSNNKKLEIFTNIFEKLKEMEAFPEEHMLKIVEGFKYLKEEEIENFECTDENICRVTSVLIFGEKEEIENVWFDYETKLKEKTRKKIDDKYATRAELLDALGKRYFNISYKDMLEITKKYGEDINTYIQKYNEKEELTEEENEELNALITIKYIKEILRIKDKDAIRKVYDEYDKDPTMDINFRERIMLDENIRRVYAKDYLKDVYRVSEDDKKVVDGIEVYAPRNFKMFTHSVAAYGKFSLIDFQKSALEIWKSGNKANHILCTSFVSNSNLAYCKNNERDVFKRKSNIILGFADIGKNSILMSSVADLSSDTQSIESYKAYRNYSFRSSENLIDYTRLLYNEVSIERRIEDNKMENILPSYVVCYDKISKESKKVSRDMNIPIVFIDRKELAIQESNKLQAMIDTFKATKEPHILKDIINLYEGNLVSFSFTRQDLVKKYFNVNKMNSIIEELIHEIKAECDNGNRENGMQCMQTLQMVFESEIEKFSFVMSKDELRSKRNIKILDFNKQVKEYLKTYRDSITENVQRQTPQKEETGFNMHIAKRKETTRIKKVKSHEGSDENEK